MKGNDEADSRGSCLAVALFAESAPAAVAAACQLPFMEPHAPVLTAALGPPVAGRRKAEAPEAVAKAVA